MKKTGKHLVASRQGIFLVDQAGYRKLADGHFFGLTLRDGFIYCFKTVPMAEAEVKPNSGSLVRYAYADGEICDPDVLVHGLDYNGHQVAFFDDSFWLVDSGNQQILEFDAGWNCKSHRIGPAVERRGPGDAHINSFHGRGDRIYLMFHNGHRKMPSEIVEFDRAFNELGRTQLASTGCHDVVPLEDGTLLYCESAKGQIALVGGGAHKIDELYTRGLAVGDHEIAVGSSLFGARAARNLLPGFVTFLNRTYQRVARVYLPAAPTQICRVDGKELSLSTPR